MSNRLKDQSSPYLIQHAENPVDWYPWCDEAFAKAKAEDKPVFLSIGYSTCHWCHVMAHESFEDEGLANILNEHFVSIKVDKEERPDIDSIYMSVCMAFTGSGGWPTSIFMTAEQKPFFAGTYFPKTSRRGSIGMRELLTTIREKWQFDRGALLESADQVVAALAGQKTAAAKLDEELVETAAELFKHSFDEQFGGFGNAPKFPTPHNLIFLLTHYEKCGDKKSLRMAETTLQQLYRGGIFDHIGYGFCRYSTDRYYLAPHFEKMLYDNALLVLAYCKAYTVTRESFYRDVAEKTASYILREMRAPNGGFYSAQDADSDGVEGKYYVFEPQEIISILGEETGRAFNEYYDITRKGNFEGRSIPNLLRNKGVNDGFNACLPAVYDYRRSRTSLHLDDKILCSWNSLMIAAMCQLYRISENAEYLEAAIKAQQFIEDELFEDGCLYVSYRDGRRSEKGFLDDYAFYSFALISLYSATLDKSYLRKAESFCHKAVSDFADEDAAGFFLYGRENEQLIVRPKESYDGAIPSGNSMMAYVLVRLYYLTYDESYAALAERQLAFMSGEAKRYPAGYAMFMTALSDYRDPPEKITVVLKNKKDLQGLVFRLPESAVVSVFEIPTAEYPLKDDRTTFYVCKNNSCLPPVNEL